MAHGKRRKKKLTTNLKAAADGENLEWANLYQKFAEVAKKEGFKDACKAFTQMAKVEKRPTKPGIWP